MQIITIYDYILLPVYLFLFYILIKRRSLNFSDVELRKIFITAFALRMLGSVAYSMLVQYYYGYGDAFTYYAGGNFIIDQIQKDFGNVKYLFTSAKELQRLYALEVGKTDGLNGYIATDASLAVMKASAMISVLSFNKFLISSIFFALFSFAGQWKLFRVFNDINNGKNKKIMAIAVLYTPAIWFWSSGLIKESICMGALGFIISIVYNGIVKKRITVLDWILLIIFIYLIYVIKSYIIIILAAVFFLTILFVIFQNIKLFVLKVFLIILTSVLILLFLSLSDFSDQLNDLALDAVSQIETFQKTYQSLQEENSKAAFEMDSFDPSAGNLFLRTPGVIFSCLFRPFLWESKKIIIVFSSLESTLLLLSTLFLLFKSKLAGFFKIIFTDPYIFFCFVFSLILAAVIGFTTFNFGTMTRYKIILLPFYYFLLVIIYTRLMKNKTALNA